MNHTACAMNHTACVHVPDAGRLNLSIHYPYTRSTNHSVQVFDHKDDAPDPNDRIAELRAEDKTDPL